MIGIASRNQSAFWANASAALAFACLSLLPAVLLDLGLATHLRPLRAVGYALGSLCALLHVSEVFVHGPEVHSFALITLSVGFALLAAVSYGISRRLGTSYSPAAAICLFLLSASFLHFRAEADAVAVAKAALMGFVLPIADMRASLVGAFQYINPIMKKLTDLIEKVERCVATEQYRKCIRLSSCAPMPPHPARPPPSRPRPAAPR